MKKFVLILVSVLVSAPAFADEWGPSIGLRSTWAECDLNAGCGDFKADSGLQLGAIYLMDAGNLALRTGVLYSQSVYKTTGPDYKVTLAHMAVPATALFKVNDTVGIFAGLVPAIKLSESSQPTAPIDNLKTFVYPLTVGTELRMNEWGLDIAYEYDTQSAYTGVKNQKALVVSLLYFLQ